MIGHWEILAVIAVILLIFGPSKLPALGRSIGEGVRNLKKGLKGEEDAEKKTMSDGKEKEDENQKKE
jgi:TatA/E family protein of Tat protein translocase